MYCKERWAWKCQAVGPALVALLAAAHMSAIRFCWVPGLVWHKTGASVFLGSLPHATKQHPIAGTHVHCLASHVLPSEVSLEVAMTSNLQQICGQCQGLLLARAVPKLAGTMEAAVKELVRKDGSQTGPCTWGTWGSSQKQFCPGRALE